MNEAETRAEHIDPALKAAGWGVIEGSRILREYRITAGRIEGHGRRGKADIADYVLVYRNTKLAVIEAKAWDEPLTLGVGQAKSYAEKLALRFTYSTNGQGIYAIDRETGKEGEIAVYPTPDELWNLTFAQANAWRDRFAAIPFEDKGGSHPGRYYQDIAVERVIQAIAEERQRILLTLATGTGKTFIAFQIAWKLFHARWNLSSQPTRRPRILFLADRNILANQAYNAFSAFPEDALVRISPDEIRRRDRVPTNGNLFFTIFQTFMSGPMRDGNVRNIVLMRPINSMIEFKQIIGRGTRLYDGKDYFTIYDFVKAHLKFHDPEWDGPPQEEEVCPKCEQRPCACEVKPPKPCAQCGKSPCECPKEPCPVCGKIACTCDKKRKVKVKLADGKERSIQHMMATTFWHPDGTPMSAQQFMELLFGKLPDFFQSEAELRTIWSAPDTRAKLLEGLADKDFGRDKLLAMQQLIDAERSDLFDVLAYVAYALPPIERTERADHARVYINSNFTAKQQAFLDFVLQHYVAEGVEELEQSKLNPLLRLKYHDSITDAVADLGGKPDEIGKVFAGFQKYLYSENRE